VKKSFVGQIPEGATTLSTMTFSITTFTIKFATQHNGRVFLCWVSFMLSVINLRITNKTIMLSVIMLSVVMLMVVAPPREPFNYIFLKKLLSLFDYIKKF
jgi:hypothetical protein